MSIRPRRRLPFAVAGLAIAALAGSQFPQAFASVPSSQQVTLPSAPGTNVVHFVGHAPFNNGQANLLFDDQTGACDGSNTTPLRDEHTVKVLVPHLPNPALDVLIRFEIDWNAVSEPTEDMRLDLFGPDGKLVSSSDSSQFQESINLTAPVPGTYSMHVCAFQTGPTGPELHRPRQRLGAPANGNPFATSVRPPGVHTVRGAERHLTRRGRAVDRQQLEDRPHVLHVEHA